MLASLFRGGSNARSNQYIDSVTDDAHTKSLLFGQSHHVLNLATSPPPSPFGSPTQRPSSFDDQGGLELDEKDVRVLLAQDAHGDAERPLLLYDSGRPAEVTSPSGKSQPSPRSPLPTTWQTAGNNVSKEETARNRSSTFSGSQSSWSKAAKSVRSQDDPFLRCMFGARYFKRTDTSTKLHIIPARNRHNRDAETSSRANSRLLEQRRRAPLARAHTSGEAPTLPALDVDNRDCLLITRLFQVTLEEGSKVVVQPKPGTDVSAEKPPKLVEAKLPQYAIGFVLQLPNTKARPRSSGSRYQSLNPTQSQSVRSAASSYGSEMQSSWTFLDAIPTSLSSSIHAIDDDDRRLDMIVDNWDVILRTMGFLEGKAAKVLKDHLEMLLRVVIEQQDKIPKEKSMQRINQRMIAIQDASFIAGHPALMAASADVARRIAYALRIPRVITGTGIVAGHWVDEARMLYRTVGSKQQNFFFFNLMTAFLGNHIQWLERLAPEWYRYRLQSAATQPNEVSLLASRTIIVSEQKGLARRLVYILASFLPGSAGIDGLGTSPNQARLALSLSPPGPSSRTQSRRSSKPFLLRPQPSTESCKAPLSTSASSQGSQTSTLANRSPRKQLSRKFSNTIQVKPDRIESELKTSAGTTSAIMPQALQTPTAYIHTLRDSYFPESAIIETNDSVASVDLTKVLDRASSTHRRTSSVSSRWGSLVSGISEIWSKPSLPGDRSSGTTVSNGISPKRTQVRSTASIPGDKRATKLDMMVDELHQDSISKRKGSVQLVDTTVFSSSEIAAERTRVNPPRLHVNDKDGVIDVELDLPNFFSASDVLDPETGPPTLRKRSTGFTQDGRESMCSFRSLSAHGEVGMNQHKVNVGGYLKRHHEDFALHAVRPYDSLIADVKRTMYQEPTPRDALDKVLLGQTTTPCWVNVCTTLVADTKALSVRRLTLRRQYEMKSPGSVVPREGPFATREGSVTLITSGATIVANAEEILDETVMAFDTTLADAIEKVLNVGAAENVKSGTTTRSHSRAVSTSSVKAVPSGSTDIVADDFKSDKAKMEQRDIVLEALEDVVNSVSDVLNQPQQSGKPKKGDLDTLQQENNFLRQGVRDWMLNVQHESVW